MTHGNAPRLAAAFLIAALSAPLGGAFSAEATLADRAGKDAYMRHDPNSPFNHASHKVEFTPLKYYEPDAGWVFESKLAAFPKQEAVTILDTKGRERKGQVFGHLSFEKDGGTHTVRVYRMDTKEGHYHGIWFTDTTTGETTYDVGRYLNFERSEDPDHVYTLDFNQAYNPYCAYNDAWSCPLPPRENWLAVPIRAGEQVFPHD